MRERARPGIDSLPLLQLQRADEVCDRFEAAWQAGQRPRIEEYLGEVPEADRAALLHELVLLDIVYRRRHGEDPQPAEYQGRSAALDVDWLAQAVGATAGGTESVARGGWPAIAGYEILAELGRGGMGVVYRAYDRERRDTVALKVMQRFDAAWLYRFKQEFRTLANLVHRNLVALYELISDGDLWFFTMESIAGVDFLTHVRAPGDPSDGGVARPARRMAGNTIPLTPGQLTRLRGALTQLVDGIVFLHDAGKLHRDIKPQNVLVTPDDRVVLIDFGLSAELDRAGTHQTTEQHLVGTAAYMAPEQAASQPVSPASDWYSVGVMLYEALTGRLPFAGAPLQVLMDKQHREPPAPREGLSGIPDDLNALCIDLLRRNPTDRPSGMEVLRRLGGLPAGAMTAPAPAASEPGVPLVGREGHLAALGDAFSAVRRGRTVLCTVHGSSGMGKSALVQHFLDGLVERREAVILAGRCYEQESVPYKALDGLVDALSRHLSGLPAPEADALVPRDVAALERLFPVLRQVKAVATAPARGPGIPDQRELRRRGVTALRELLARLGERTPLVLCLDDLQWGDEDSAALLAEVLRPPDQPVFLLLACYRSEDAAKSPFLRAFLPSRPSWPGPDPSKVDPTLDRRELPVEALTPSAARRLALALLGPAGPAAQAQADAIVQESGGNPFFVHELARSLRAADGIVESLSPARAPTLDQVLWSRIERLETEARQLLQVVAVAGRPIRAREACTAAGLGEGNRTAVAILRSDRLIRGTGPSARSGIETYHDRIRETVLARLAPAGLVDHHRRLAHTLEGSGQADPEALAVHFQGAQEPGRAAHFFGLAAAQAAGALAFDHAAKLFRLALALRPAEEPAAERRLRTELGHALANAGRGAEAAREYLAATDGPDALELQRLAAAQLLYSGHVKQGLASFRQVLDAVGLTLPPTPRRALLPLLVRRVQIRLRGTHFQERDAAQVPGDDLRRIDVCWPVVLGLGVIDPIRAALFQTHHLRLALRAGEPYRVARALAIEATFSAAAGLPAAQRTAALVDTAASLAQRLGHPHALALATLAGATAAYLEGRWKDAFTLAEGAERILRDSCTGVTRELDSARHLSRAALFLLGEIAELSRRLPRSLEEAQERGDFFAMTASGTYFRPVVRMAADEPEKARRELDELLERLPHQEFPIQHMDGVYHQGEIDLYTGDGSAARARAPELLSVASTLLLTKVQHIRMQVYHFTGRSALAAASCARDPRPHLRAAERDARRLEREQTPNSEAMGALIRAGVLAMRGDSAGATALLASTVARCDALGVALYAAAARRRLGRLLGGDEGQRLVAQADAFMASQEIRNPERMTAMLAPGFPD